MRDPESQDPVKRPWCNRAQIQDRVHLKKTSRTAAAVSQFGASEIAQSPETAMAVCPERKIVGDVIGHQ